MRTSLLSAVFLVVAAVSCFAAENVKPKETSNSFSNGYVGKPVAAFEAVSTSGKTLSSSSHGAKALIIDLWGLSCTSCLEEMKALQPIYEEFSGKGLKIWAVNTEEMNARQIIQGLRVRGLELSYDVVPDPGLTITKNFTNWFIPVTVIVDSKGIVQYYKIGYNEKDAKKIKAMVGALLAQ